MSCLHKLLNISCLIWQPSQRPAFQMCTLFFRRLKSYAWDGQDMWPAYILIICQDSRCMASSVRTSAQLEDRKSTSRIPWKYPWKASVLRSPPGRPLLVTTPWGPLSARHCCSTEAKNHQGRERKGSSQKGRVTNTYVIGPPPPPCVCPICGKDFLAQIGLISHLQTHRTQSTKPKVNGPHCLWWINDKNICRVSIAVTVPQPKPEQELVRSNL